MIYFIRSGEFVKIGYTSKGTVDGRLADLQTGSPRELEPLVEVDGDRKVESALHSIFSEERVSGEWFTLSRRLIRTVGLLIHDPGYLDLLLREQLGTWLHRAAHPEVYPPARRSVSSQLRYCQGLASPGPR